MYKTVFMCVSLTFFCCLNVIDESRAQSPVDASSHDQTVKKTAFSLENLYEMALKQAEQIKIAEKDLFIAEKDEDRAFAVLVPSLTAFGEYQRYNEEKNALPESSQAWGARLDQRFTLNGRELTGFQMAKDNIEKSRFDLDAVRKAYLLRIASAYYTILKNKKALEIAKSNVERLEAYKQAIQLRLELKDTPRTELYRAEAELSGSETERMAAENNLRFSRISLARLVPLPKDFELVPPKNLKPERDFPPLDQLIRSALVKRIDLKSLEMAKKISESEIDYYKGAHWPVIALEGVYTSLDSDPEWYYPDDESLRVGVSVNFPLFEGGLRSAEISQARARARQLELQMKDAVKEVAVDVEQSWLDLQTSESALGSLGDKLKSAQENYHAVLQQYEHGLADSLDVIDANTLLLVSERGLLDATYNYKLSILNLERAEGSLLENIRQKIKQHAGASDPETGKDIDNTEVKTNTDDNQ